MVFTQDRMDVYQNLESEIGKTPLKKYNGVVPNRNRIWIKRECDNPFGSHYDRVYMALFKQFEEAGKIRDQINYLQQINQLFYIKPGC